MDWFIPALLGFIGGIAGSLVAPWVHWAIEKRRSSNEYKKNMIKEWREQIEAFDWQEENFGNSGTYAAMRPHMGEEIKKKFETPRVIHIPPEGGRGENLAKQWASDEVARIESAWGLV